MKGVALGRKRGKTYGKSPTLIISLLAPIVLCGDGCSKSGGTAARIQSPSTATSKPSLEPDVPIDRGNVPRELPQAGYISSRACRECHPEEHSTWSASYHRTMTQVVNPRVVAGRFDGQELNFYGWRFRPERVGDEFWLHIRGSSGSPSFQRKLVMTTGSHHMQKYWYHTGTSRKMGLAPLVYLIESDLWVPEHTAFLRPTESGLPFREGTWNKACNQCHATGSQPRLFGSDNMDTQVAEFGISCEACHGPGQQHVLAMVDAASNGTQPDAQASMVNPRHLPPERSAEVCGQCHGVWVMTEAQIGSWATTGHLYRPGDNLGKTRRYIHGMEDQHLHSDVHAEDSFWSDGQIRVTGREYNGLLASPCFAHTGNDNQRMTCLSCHDMHAMTQDAETSKTWSNDQLGSGMHGNDACYQCHRSFRRGLSEHTKHSTNSAGSLCYNCHMPYTSYGLLKAVRSHTITSPTIEASLGAGRPNACNQCHLDQTLQWAAQHLNSWYGHEIPRLDKEQRQVVASLLWSLRGDAGQRALMAWSMGWESAREVSGSDWMVFFLTDLMFDDYDAIRYIAYRSLRQIPGFGSLQYDHMHANEQRDRIMAEVMTTWQATISQRPRDAKLLYDGQGNIRFDAYQMLRGQRDNRKVIITE